MFTESAYVSTVHKKKFEKFSLPKKNLFADLRLITHPNNLRGFDLLLT